MVQREVGRAVRRRRPARRPYGAVSVKVAYWATARHRRRTCRRRCSCPGPTSSRRWSRSSAATAARRRDPTLLFPLVRTGVRPAAQDAAPLARRASSTPEQFAAAGVAPDGAARGARRRRLGAASPTRSPRDVTPTSTSARPAKLTLTLRITGVPRRRLPPDRRRDGDASTSPTSLTIDPRRRRRRRSTAVRRRRADRRRATSSPRRCALVGRRPRVHDRQADPPRRRARRRFGRRRRGAALGRRRPIRGRVAALGADVPFCLVGGRARVRGIGEIVEPLAARRARRHAVVPPLHVSTPAVYRAWDELGGPTGVGPQRPRAGGDRGRAASWRGGATASATLSGERRCSPAAAPRGSCHGRARRRPRRACATRALTMVV